MRISELLVALTLTSGCAKSPPRAQVKLADHPAVPDVTPVDAVALEDAVAPIDAIPPIDAVVPTDARTRRVVKVRGRGTCETDTDCVLTSYQEGCCVQACQGYASSKLDLAARQSKENCAARGNAICPPPSPCRVPTHKVLSAACSAHRCVSLEEELP